MPLSPQEIEAARKKYGISAPAQPSQGDAYVSSRVSRLKAIRDEEEATKKAEEEKNKPGIFSRIGSDIKKRAGDAYDTMSEAARGEISPLEAGIRVVGQGVAIPGDIVGEGLKSAYDVAVPDVAKPYIEKGVSKALQVAGVPEAMNMYGDFSAAHPRAAKNIEAIANIASVIPEGKAAQVAGTAAKVGIGEGVEIVGKKLAQRAIEKVDDAAVGKFVKAVRPSVSNMSTEAASKAYIGKAKRAINAIVENEPNITLVDDAGEAIATPQSLQHFSQAIDQTKKDVFKRYSAKAAAAGEQGAQVELSNVAKELRSMADNVVLQDKDPGLVAKIAQKADLLEKRGMYTPEQAQEAIKMYNDSLEAFYKNPSYDSASTAAVDAMIANNLRSSLDNAVESMTGAGYQELKNTYGALKSIEKDVSKRALVDARKNAKGLLDFTDIATGAGAVNALLSMNPAQMASAATAGVIKKLYKHLNDPNQIVKSLFKDIKNVKTKAAKYGLTSEESSFVKSAAE